MLKRITWLRSPKVLPGNEMTLCLRSLYARRGWRGLVSATDLTLQTMADRKSVC
jgi:hypothetical protein